MASAQYNAQVLREASDISPDGSYNFNYETDNGISFQESGSPRVQGPEGPAVASQGSYSFVAPDGVQYTVTYVADENGFQAQGAHLPVAPPVPEAIQRSIQYNLANAGNQQFRF